jgi:hydroxymethylpyrimidine/phosphomethylpyrimidine kinase
MRLPAVLAIAGTDSSGGAGIPADIKTIAAHHLYAECAITAVTAQDTCGVRDVQPIDARIVGSQVDACFEDIPPAAVKVGMVGSAETCSAIARALLAHHAKNVVLDPVMVATSGTALADDATVDALARELFPLASVVTPNIPEAERLADVRITDEDGAEAAADAIARLTPGAVLVKGGHAARGADDLLRLASGEMVWLRARRIEAQGTHGTGCTLSSAIACGLACGRPLEDAIRVAKAYLEGALAAGLDLGHGNGPVDHMWELPLPLGSCAR